MKDQQPPKNLKLAKITLNLAMAVLVVYGAATLSYRGYLSLKEWDITRARRMVYAESNAANISEKEMTREQLITALGASTEKVWECQRKLVAVGNLVKDLGD